MGTEIKISEYTDNGEQAWLPRTVPGTLGGPNPKFRSAGVNIQISFDETGAAQAKVALDALDAAYQSASSHPHALLEVAQEKEDEAQRYRERQERMARELRDDKEIVGKVAEEFLANEDPVRLPVGTEVEVLRDQEGGPPVGTRFVITEYVTAQDALGGQPLYWGSAQGGTNNVWALACDVRPVG